ncbi:hypothetical protein PENSPDRAFT_347281 [Peniophora sp. CONT]|nr:hypothetical protein PENSPDRAFT_347281 [Peniophora sp. CONT]
MTVQFQKKLLGQHPPRFIVDLNALRGFIQQFSNLLVILRNRITGVRLELQQLHGPAGPRPPSVQGGPPGPPGPPHMGQMGQGQLGVPGQPQHGVGVGLPNQPPVPPQGLGRVPTPLGMGRVPTPQQGYPRVPTPAQQFPPTPLLNSAEQMPPPLVPAQQHKRKVSENMQSPAAAAVGSPHTPAPAAAASPQTPQTPKPKPKPRPKVPRRKSVVQPAPAVEDKDSKDVSIAESSTSAASTSNLNKGNKRPREEEPAIAAASPKRAKADWEGPPSDVQERRVKAAEEAPRDDAAAADFVDDMMRQFASYEGDTAPLVSGINAILASVMPGGAGGVGGGIEVGKDDGAGLDGNGGLGADDIFDFSQYLDFDAGLGTGNGAGTVGATPELVHGSSANPSPESGSEPEAGVGGAPASNATGSSDKTPGGLGELTFGTLDDPLHTGFWSEIDGGETSYYHGNPGWRYDGAMAASEQPWAISTS